ncbi:exodeoxyribonuclease V alpha subunit [Prosthecobacter fusiformis]|uniref:Exodeoxyribonuclease V alpha subunit n=1 Tax=Prosthecobacter fusiformis TaxID=48464 RepID=A0A4R7RZL4_9BACT|nr:ATP-dependent RecD-like DNA helicase [Prosthecobacter fusiformis]TDU70859.1 exodeoxyribonuclease V alpha subunit [Prosthecobacter fusiformis]
MNRDASPAPAETLYGLVERVVYHTEETGYCILKVIPKGRREPVSLIGKSPRVVAGEQFEAMGHWESTRDYGQQFKADTLKLTRPDSSEGIEKYLGSGLIEGIGPAYAKRLVKKFGKAIFEIIENESSKLEGVEGIGKKRRQEIRESWMKQKSVHNIMLFLHQNGISSSRALRIHKTYGDEALSVLTTNPYRLAQDIHGIGFKTADGIAHQMGVAKDAPERIRAGILHGLETAAASGHCCLPEEALMAQTAQLLDCAPNLVSPQVAALITSSLLERHDLKGQPVLYLPYLRAAEQSIAHSIHELTALPAAYPIMDQEKMIAQAAQDTGKVLAESQQRAVKEALQNRCLIITGGPGVGKTTILRTILTILGRQKVKMTLAAPTGRAAKRLNESTGIEAKTLHRLLEYQGQGTWGRHRGKPLTGDLFVVDECSMLDAPLMAQFLSALPEGAHLLLVGDADQLPSVGPGMVLNDLITSGKVPCVQLTEIFRQAATSRIITSAHEINCGRVPDLKPQRDGDFFFLETQSPEETRDLIVQLAHQRLPAKYKFDPVQDIQVLTPMNRHLLGTRSLNEALQSALNPPSDLKYELERFQTTFRVGDKVIQTHNNYDKEVFNGDIGHIVTIETEPLKMSVRFEGDRLVEYEPGELDELQLAYALTIHKSQGSEFPCVIIPVSTQHYVLLERSLIYTAVTRARRLVILVGDPRALSLAVGRQESRKRWTGLQDLL